MRTSCALLAVAALLGLPVASPAQLSPSIQESAAGAAVAAPADEDLRTLPEEAAYIAQYDDGEADTYVFGSPSTKIFEIAMRFDGIGGSPLITLGSIDVCLRRTGTDTRMRFEAVVWAANGPGGSPGTELARYAGLATSVATTPAFYSTSFDYPLTTATVYLGIRYNPIVDPDFAFCIDTDGATVHPVHYRTNESGSWNDLGGFLPTYNALMLRASIFTPGVFQETLLVPSYLVDATSGFGTTTLFAVRNLTNATVTAQVEYFDALGGSLSTSPLTLAAREVETVNVRDVPGLPADPDGHRRGFVEISAAGNADQTPVLGGDFFQVDVGGNFATGEKLIRRTQLCDRASVRFLAFPGGGSGTRLALWIANPRGTGLSDPVSFTVQVFDEAGTALGPAILYHTDRHILDIPVSDLTALPFGFLRFDFTGASGGAVYAEATASGRYAVGVTGQCYESP